MTDKYQEITGDASTLRLLARIKNHRGLIYVRINENTTPWSSAIIAVDNDRHVWRFDELPTAEGHRQLLKKRRCEIETHLDGVPVKFQTEVMTSGIDQKGLSYYEASLPREIRVYQRRSSFRAQLSAACHAGMKFIVPGVAIMRGHVRDISECGVKADFSNCTQIVDSGLYIPNSTLTFPDNKSIGCDLSVRFVRRSSFGMSIGAQFVKISKENQKQVVQFVAFLDRERAKRKHLTP